METWAVDLKDVGAVYPWQGAEFAMAIIAIAAWIAWHFIQASKERKMYDAKVRKYANNHDAMMKSLDENP